MEEERKRKREEVATTEDDQPSGAVQVTPEKKRRQKAESQEEAQKEETPEEEEEEVASDQEEDEVEDASEQAEEVEEHGEAHKEGTDEENQKQEAQDDDEDEDQQVASSSSSSSSSCPANGETVFEFGKYIHKTFRHVIETDVSYVNWARRVENPSSQLRLFIDWTNSSEAQELFRKASGNERFTFGQHAGMTFHEIARTDPTYHVRYKAMQRGPPVLDRYIEWFNQYSGISPHVLQWHRLQDMMEYGGSGLFPPPYSYDEDEYEQDGF
jgi:hypothetical protein